jgi:hypothetical protein
VLTLLMSEGADDVLCVLLGSLGGMVMNMFGFGGKKGSGDGKEEL